MAYRKATGRPMKVPKTLVTTRDHLRYHLRRRGKKIVDFAKVWDMHPVSAYRRFYDSRPMTPNYIETAIEFLEIDQLDATKLRLTAAREAGWLLDPKYIKLLD